MTFILHKLEKSPLILASEIPDSLRLVIEKMQGYSYAELYEEKDIQRISLEKSLITVFDAIEKEKNSLDISYCYFFMAIVMGIAVQPTIKTYLRNCIWKVVGNNQSQGNTDLEKQNLLLRFLAQ